MQAYSIPWDTITRPAVITIDLGHLAHNYRLLKSKAINSKMMVVLKANAYGHGMSQCARRLAQDGADYIGVAIPEEGQQLRESGITLPVLVFGALLPEHLERCFKFELDITIPSEAALRLVAAQAAALGRKARIHLKIDTGMGRIGAQPREAVSLLEAAARTQHVEVVGLYSHLAGADEVDATTANNQLAVFTEIVQEARRRFPLGLLCHLANSAAIARFPDSHFDMVRAGISLYGVQPVPSSIGVLPLRPVLSLYARVLHLKEVAPKTPISYGGTWVASRTARIATLGIGYGDGFFRSLSNRAHVLIAGIPCPIVGRICMDQCMIDVSEVENVSIGDEAVFIGQQGQSFVSVAQLASILDTIPYEVLCHINNRIPRLYI